MKAHHWKDLRASAGQLGEAFARRLYPKAKPDPTKVFDFVLPDSGTRVEAKSAQIGNHILFTDSQIRAIPTLKHVRVLVTIYDPEIASKLRPDNVLLSVSRSVRLLLDAPGWLFQALVMRTEFNSLPVVMALRIAEGHPEAKVRVMSRLDTRVGKQRVQRHALPICVIGVNNEIDFRDTAERVGERRYLSHAEKTKIIWPTGPDLLTTPF